MSDNFKYFTIGLLVIILFGAGIGLFAGLYDWPQNDDGQDEEIIEGGDDPFTFTQRGATYLGDATNPEDLEPSLLPIVYPSPLNEYNRYDIDSVKLIGYGNYSIASDFLTFVGDQTNMLIEASEGKEDRYRYRNKKHSERIIISSDAPLEDPLREWNYYLYQTDYFHLDLIRKVSGPDKEMSFKIQRADQVEWDITALTTTDVIEDAQRYGFLQLDDFSQFYLNLDGKDQYLVQDYHNVKFDYFDYQINNSESTHNMLQIDIIDGVIKKYYYNDDELHVLNIPNFHLLIKDNVCPNDEQSVEADIEINYLVYDPFAWEIKDSTRINESLPETCL